MINTDTIPTRPVQPTPKREFTGVFIPAFIWDHPELNWTEKCLLAEIHAIGGHRGECFASNEYLADKMQVSAVRVRSMISHLKELLLVKQVSFDGRVRKLKTFLDADGGARSDRSKMSGVGAQKGAGRPLKNERAPNREIQEEIQEEKDSATPAGPASESAPKILDAEGDPLKLEAPALTPESKFKTFVELWSDAYQSRVGAPYPFAGGRDGKAVKLLTSNCRTPEQLVELAEWCWANLSGFVGQQCLTIHGFQSQQAVVQGMRAQREGRTRKPVLTEAQKAANVVAGSEWRNVEF